MKLEEKILALRKKKGLSQEGLAKRLNVTRQAVYKWESGISRPDIDKILAIAHLFNISSDVLLNDKLGLEFATRTGDTVGHKQEAESTQNTNEKKEDAPSLDKKDSKKRNILISIVVFALILAVIIVCVIIGSSQGRNLPTENQGNGNLNTGINQGGAGTQAGNTSQNAGNSGEESGNQGGDILAPDLEVCSHEYKLQSFNENVHVDICIKCESNLELSHTYEDGKCTYCGYYPANYSQGLKFEKITGSEEYALVSIGTNKESHVKIPPMYNGLPVTRINMYAFDDCSRVTKITVPVSIKYIEGNAFLGAGDSKNNTAYYEMARLHLYYEGTLSQWMKIFFGPHSNTGNTVLYINETAIDDLVIPEDIEEIGPNTFNFMMFDSVTIGSNVKKIRQNAFYFADIRNLIIEEGLEEIGDSAFYYVSDFDEIVFPKTLKKIGRFTFYGTKITLLTLPDSVEYLGDSAFAFCSKLLRASLGSGLCYIGSNTFNSCDSLTVLGIKVEGVYEIYDSSNIKLGTMEGAKLSKDPYMYMVWRNPEYTYIKQGYEQ